MVWLRGPTASGYKLNIDRHKFLVQENGLRITAVAETHIHADFVSGAEEFVVDPDIHLYLSGEGGPDWNYQWPKPGPNTRLLKNGDSFMVGNIPVEAIHTPGAASGGTLGETARL